MAVTVQRELSQIDQWGNPRTPFIYPSNGSYLVRLPDDAGGRSHRFSVHTHSDPLSALNAARTWRDRRLPRSHRARVLRHENHTEVAFSRGIFAPERTSLGKPGLDLVNPANTTIYDGTNLLIKATASDLAGNRNLQRMFSIRQLGFETALRYALRERLKWERTYYGHRTKLSEDDWVEFITLCHTQFGHRKVDMDQLEYPGSVTYPTGVGCQARAAVDGVQESAYFSSVKYGSRHEADVAAVLWCVRNHAKRNPMGSYVLLRASARNKSTGVPGVYRRAINDGRSKRRLIVYEADTKVDGKRRMMRFSVGREGSVTEEQETHALAAATDCRTMYLANRKSGCVFDPRRWHGWKKNYGFPEAA